MAKGNSKIIRRIGGLLTMLKDPTPAERSLLSLLVEEKIVDVEKTDTKPDRPSGD